MLQKNTQAKKVTTKSIKTVVTKKSTSPVGAKKTPKQSVTKSAKKVATKVPVVKIGRKISGGKKALVIAPAEKKFWVQTGEILESLTDLATSFAKMDAVAYQHHVDTTKNDFASWVEHVLEDVLCADALRRSKTPKTARIAVIKYLKQYDV